MIGNGHSFAVITKTAVSGRVMGSLFHGALRTTSLVNRSSTFVSDLRAMVRGLTPVRMKH